MKANRTGIDNPPPKIEDLGDDTFYYNFNVNKSELTEQESGGNDINWDYDQVRCSFPIDKNIVQNEVNKAGYDHTVNLTDNE